MFINGYVAIFTAPQCYLLKIIVGI